MDADIAISPAIAPDVADGFFETIDREIDRWALFLDIDGTLIDLAATPDTIHVPPDLPAGLHGLSARLNGALALVTGRALNYADGLFKPYRFPVAGLHGAEMRLGDGTMIAPPIPPEFSALKIDLARNLSKVDGVLVEDKGGAIATHYRLAPHLEEAIGEIMRAYAEQAGEGYVLQLGKMVYEIRPAHSSKGDAVKRFLSEPMFAGRRALAIGDDLTDESMFSTVNALGGYSIRIGSAQVKTLAQARLPSPQAVRDAIALMARTKTG